MPPKTKNMIKKVKKRNLRPSPRLEDSNRTSMLGGLEKSSSSICQIVASRTQQTFESFREFASDSSVSSDVVSSSDEEDRWKEKIIKRSQLPSDYWEIQKLFKHMKAGNQTVTVVMLCCLKDHDLTKQINQVAIQDIGGLEVLVNILECDDLKCRLGALVVLSIISLNMDIQRSIVDLGVIPILVRIISESSEHLKTLAAEIIANVGKIRLARKLIGSFGGIPKLIELLDIPLVCLVTERQALSESQSKQLNKARAGARALWSISESHHNKKIMRKSGIVALMVRLLKSIHVDIVLPVIGCIQQCASQGDFQLAVATEGMLHSIVIHLKSSNNDLKLQCCEAISKFAIDEMACDIVRETGGLELLVDIIGEGSTRENAKLLEAATRAVWICAAAPANVNILEKLEIMKFLGNLLNDQDENILTNVAGAIFECVKAQSNRDMLRQSGSLALMVNQLNGFHPPLLVNISKALTECANDPESMSIMQELGVIRLLWSLLKKSHPRVQAYAAFALCPCIERTENSGELVRYLYGALELVVQLLKSTDNLVVAAICAVISVIAKDKGNLAMLTDLKVLPMLAGLIHTTDETLREHLAAAIASCVPYENNVQEFGRLKVVLPLVVYMASENPGVHRTTLMALHALSQDPQNCITMHTNGVVHFLIKTISPDNREFQALASRCLKNIRKLALRAEQLAYLK